MTEMICMRVRSTMTATLAVLSLCACGGSLSDHQCPCTEAVASEAPAPVPAPAAAVPPPAFAVASLDGVPRDAHHEFLREAEEQARMMHRGGRWVDRIIDDENWTPVRPAIRTSLVVPRPVVPTSPEAGNPTTDSGALTSMAVGYMILPERSSLPCTGWLIAKDKVVTNHHCVSSEREARGARITFDYVEGVDDEALTWYDCSTFMNAWADVDAAVLRCSPREGQMPGERYGVLKLADADPQAGDRVYLIHNICNYVQDPDCARFKKNSPGKILKVAYGPAGFTHTADTLNGSSGAPILADSGRSRHRVVGMHHNGCTLAHDCMAESSDGHGIFNIAVHARAFRTRLAELGL